MPTKDIRESNERRAYFRLLRYLLGQEVEDSYKEEQTQPLPPRMADLMKALEAKDPSQHH